MLNSLPKYSPMRGRPAAMRSGRKSVQAAATTNSRMTAATASNVSVRRARRNAPKRCWNRGYAGTSGGAAVIMPSVAVAAPLGLAQVDDVLVEVHRRRHVADTGALLDRVVGVLVLLRQVQHDLCERCLQARWQDRAHAPRSVGQ